ncbi:MULTISPECIES: HNH endonuclease [Streptomyces]|uniref:HNH endonuclease n=1 Tax=Streptomyces TaxID=1883 RepID=UPI00163D2ADB|nr:MULTISPECIES: HNH endonuclease signature motif containing protein [Streptomyces]MBC2876002.1 HNH endonuclease [Streptomyces sp. TYQ1024]UBI38368.1 HNH endonuclease [Streptomyces mobaraensis]UKW30952.1 HNH endonuclease [Streptomyces sp. TYQ1024]
MEAAPNPPDWQDTRHGSKIRVAAWLATVVGEGNSFTREQLHEAFQGVTHIERRMRDLRDSGWEIETYRGGAHGTEMRLIKIGEPVWSPSYRRVSRPFVASQQRHQVLARDEYRCTDCGLGAGERDPSAPAGAAALEVHFVVPLSAGGSADITNMVTLCASCNAGRRGSPVTDPEAVSLEVSRLTFQERMILLAWMAKGERTTSPVERAWVMYRHLSPEQRQLMRQKLSETVERAVTDSMAD